MSTVEEMPKVQYENENVLLMLYRQDAESPFPETALVELYFKTQKDKLFGRSFTGFGKYVTLNKFISYLSNKPIVIGIDKKNNNLIGYGYLAESVLCKAGRKATAGYVFFKEYWGTQHIRDLCRITLEHWFIGLNIDVLYGLMAANNRLAFRFATQELGFHMVGRLPKSLITDEAMIDEIMVVLERDEFLAKRGAVQ